MAKLTKALLVITDLEPDDLIAIKTLWLTSSQLASRGYTSIWLVVCGNADVEKRTWLVENIPSTSWQGLECEYFAGTLNKPEHDSRFAPWSQHADKLTLGISDAIVLAPCDDLLPVVQSHNCQLQTVFNQGGGAPATGVVTFNWANVENTKKMHHAMQTLPECTYYLINSEFVKSEQPEYPYKGGSVHCGNAGTMHSALMNNKEIRKVVDKWNETARSNPRLPAQVRALLDKPLQFTPADVLVVYGFLVVCGIWYDPGLHWTRYGDINIMENCKVQYVHPEDKRTGVFNVIKSISFSEFEQYIADTHNDSQGC